MLIKGEMENKEDLIALTGLYIDEETHCTHQPLLAKQGDFVTILAANQRPETLIRPQKSVLVLIILNDEIRLLFYVMRCPLAN